MTKRPDIPKEIGPHDGRELALMLVGDKPLAMFSDIVPSPYNWPDAAFEPYASARVLVKKEFLEDRPEGHTVRHLFYALPDEAWRIEEAYSLSLMHFDKPRDEADECCARLGHLLGYSEGEVQAFIRWTKEEAISHRP